MSINTVHFQKYFYISAQEQFLPKYYFDSKEITLIEEHI